MAPKAPIGYQQSSDVFNNNLNHGNYDQVDRDIAIQKAQKISKKNALTRIGVRKGLPQELTNKIGDFFDSDDIVLPMPRTMHGQAARTLVNTPRTGRLLVGVTKKSTKKRLMDLFTRKKEPKIHTEK